MKVTDRRTLSLISKMNRAFRDYPMLVDGDRVAVAVSGGSDSLSLLYLLQVRKPLTPERYDLIAIHIAGDARGPFAIPFHQPLIDWLSANRFAYVVTPMQLPEGEQLPMKCQRCTWNRRSTLFKVANRLDCNKIALGHHFDDMVETALLNLLYQGRMATMYPYASYFGGKFSLIRPLIYITKRELHAFAKANNFPEPPPPCPNSETNKRKVIMDILNVADKDYQNMRRNIFKAAIRYMKLEEQIKDASDPSSHTGGDEREK